MISFRMNKSDQIRFTLKNLLDSINSTWIVLALIDLTLIDLAWMDRLGWIGLAWMDRLGLDG